MIIRYLGTVAEQSPFRYLKRHAKAFGFEVSWNSVLECGFDRMIRAADIRDSWSRYNESNVVSDSTRSIAHTRPLVAAVRMEWHKYYINKACAIIDQAKLLKDLFPTRVFDKDNPEDLCNPNIKAVDKWAVGLAVEAGYFIGRANAYKFYHIKIVGINHGSDAADTVVNYRDYLRSVTRHEAIAALSVDRKISQLGGRSNLAKSMHSDVVRCAKPFENLGMSRKPMQHAATAGYKDALDTVSASFREMVTTDWTHAKATDPRKDKEHDEVKYGGPDEKSDDAAIDIPQAQIQVDLPADFIEALGDEEIPSFDVSEELAASLIGYADEAADEFSETMPAYTAVCGEIISLVRDQWKCKIPVREIDMCRVIKDSIRDDLKSDTAAEETIRLIERLCDSHSSGSERTSIMI